MSKLKAIMSGKGENHIIPLFWQHHEDHDRLAEWLLKIHDSGIGEVCLESRPHPDFVGEKWWEDLEFLIKEAKKLGMRIWLFDDSAFPTGACAGKGAGLPDELKKQHVTKRCIDVIGPEEGSAVYLTDTERDNFICAAAVVKNPDGSFGESIDISDKLVGNTLYWDIPEGVYRIFIVYRIFGTDLHDEYMNVLDKDSVKLLIDSVYQAHYDRFADEFGKTIAGFFSDEPGFYNIPSYEAVIGRDMPLPYSKDLHAVLSDALGADFGAYYPYLWCGGEHSAKIRYIYMDCVSRLYEQNMCMQIGDWCRAHNVEYIGHVIEDDNAHARLGYGAGHFFRALWGQDFSGIDVVLLQIMPGMREPHSKNFIAEYDGEFFHYALAKLGSSLAHIDPKKKGRALCEIFGAYGWAEGLKLMKWLADHMLVRGINYFMPHAFTPREFPDPDCPPHFYAGGNNPQFRYFKILMDYINRVSRLLSGGVHKACAAVFYHAESEWSGSCMTVQKPMRVLMENQIDADILPYDIAEEIKFADGAFELCGERYDTLIVPECEYIPDKACAALSRLMGRGNVVFLGGIPQKLCGGGSAKELLYGAQVCTPEELAGRVKRDVRCAQKQDYLRYYHYINDGLDYYMFFNEDPKKEIKTNISLSALDEQKYLYRYDIFENKLYRADTELKLSPYESVIYIVSDSELAAENAPKPGAREYMLKSEYELSLASAKEYPEFKPAGRINRLSSMADRDKFPDFSGTFAYESEFSMPEKSGKIFLDLGKAYETAEVWVNGVQCGVRICPPYIFDITDAVEKGENKIRIEVTNTLAKQEKDSFSIHTLQEASGLLGPVKILY